MISVPMLKVSGGEIDDIQAVRVPFGEAQLLFIDAAFVS